MFFVFGLEQGLYLVAYLKGFYFTGVPRGAKYVYLDFQGVACLNKGVQKWGGFLAEEVFSQ